MGRSIHTEEHHKRNSSARRASGFTTCLQQHLCVILKLRRWGYFFCLCFLFRRPDRHPPPAPHPACPYVRRASCTRVLYGGGPVAGVKLSVWLTGICLFLAAIVCSALFEAILRDPTRPLLNLLPHRPTQAVCKQLVRPNCGQSFVWPGTIYTWIYLSIWRGIIKSTKRSKHDRITVEDQSVKLLHGIQGLMNLSHCCIRRSAVLVVIGSGQYQAQSRNFEERSSLEQSVVVGQFKFECLIRTLLWRQGLYL